MEFSEYENKLKNLASHYSAILSLLWIKFVSNFFVAILENQSMLVKLEANWKRRASVLRTL